LGRCDPLPDERERVACQEALDVVVAEVDDDSTAAVLEVLEGRQQLPDGVHVEPVGAPFVLAK